MCMYICLSQFKEFLLLRFCIYKNDMGEQLRNVTSAATAVADVKEQII